MNILSTETVMTDQTQSSTVSRITSLLRRQLINQPQCMGGYREEWLWRNGLLVFPGQAAKQQHSSCFKTQLVVNATMCENLPTVRPREPHDVAEDVATLEKAMKGLGTDEAAIIRVLTGCSSSQRQVILQQYNSSLEKDLIKDLKGELSGDFEAVIMALMTPLHDYLARELGEALKKKKAEVIVEIICTLDHRNMILLKSSYEQQFEAKLEEDLKKATSGTFEAVLVAMVKEERSDMYFEDLDLDVARNLYNNGRGLDEEELVRVLAKLSFKQLKGVFAEYCKVAGKTLGETIGMELKDDQKTNMQTVFRCLQNRYSFLASALHRTVEGLGTSEQDLTRLIVSRSEVDLGNIKAEYYNMYNSELEKDIKGDTSGDYKKVLLALVNPN